MNRIKTDLAVEAHELWRESSGETTKLPGVIADSGHERGFFVERVSITSRQGADALGKPCGSYATLGLDALQDKTAFDDGVNVFGGLLRELLGTPDSVLVVGLGNSGITSDSLGPRVAEQILVTRHIAHAPEVAAMRTVSAFQTGVAGTTGMESGELVRAVVAGVRPSCVIAVDALASRKLSRVCRTVQLADSGITPGSGIGNARKELTREALGVPVIAVGVPTVVHAASFASDFATDADVEGSDEMVITPKDIDLRVRELSRFVAYGINLALHDGLTVADLRAVLQ